MYSRRLIEQRLSKLAHPPKYYTYDYIRACVGHLDDLALRDDKGRIDGTRRPLLPDEATFIANERYLCGVDYLHWAENYHFVRDAITLALVPFRQNQYQQVLTLAQAEMEEAGKPVIVQLLKARQGGGTTDTTSKIEHRILFVPNTAAVIASSDMDKSWKLSEMISRSLPKQPWWLIPPNLKEYQSGEIFLDCFDRNSYITIQHGAQGTGISRGDTVNCFHLSELPDYDNPDLIVDASLFGAWHPTPLHFGVLESTAKGRKNWWHKRWLNNKEQWPKGLSLERPLFLPYYISRDLYPTEGWLMAIPIPNNWTPPEHVIDHSRRAEEYVHTNPFLKQVMGTDWTMPLATQWWYSYSYDEALRKDKLGDFLSEFPSSDTEAFQSQSKSVFSIQLIQEYESKIKPPVGVFKLSGSNMPPALIAEKSEIFHGDKSISIAHDSANESLKWTLTPIKFPGYSAVNSHLNQLWIWEYPLEDEQYCLALDAAEGIGRDRTVLTMVRKGTPARAAGQVAVFSSDTIGGLEIWPIALMLLNYYSTYSTFKRDLSKPLFSPETKADASSCLMEIRKRGYTRIYLRRDLAKRKQDSTIIRKLGWETTQNTRELLIQWLLTTLKGHYIELNSPWTIDEMRDFVAIESATSSKIRIEHDKSSHDDELFALGIAVVTLHELDVYRGETPQWRATIEAAEQLIQFATFNKGYAELKFDPGDLTPAIEKQKGVMYPTNPTNSTNPNKKGEITS